VFAQAQDCLHWVQKWDSTPLLPSHLLSELARP
jgi:hypothetical protein